MKNLNKVILVTCVGTSMVYLTIYIAVLNLLVTYTPYVASMLGSFVVWLISFFKS